MGRAANQAPAPPPTDDAEDDARSGTTTTRDAPRGRTRPPPSRTTRGSAEAPARPLAATWRRVGAPLVPHGSRPPPSGDSGTAARASRRRCSARAFSPTGRPARKFVRIRIGLPACGCREPHKFDAPLDHRPRHSHGFLRSQRHVLGLHRGFRRWHGHGPSRGARRVRARQVHGQASPGGACHNRVRHRHPSPRGVPSLGPSGALSRRSTSTADATRPIPRVFQPRSARTRASLPTPSRPQRRPLTRSPRSSPFIHSPFHPRAEGDRRGSRHPGGQGQEGQEVDAPIRPTRSCNVT